MHIHTLSMFLATAVTGYGEVVDGRPNWAQRELQVYGNLARVSPEEWESEYDCSLSEFTSTERTPQAPLFFHDGLTEIAQAHSADMHVNEFISHSSSDGTDFGERVWPWYDGSMIAENVATGYMDAWSVVFEGWMCSAGHRENIMSPDLEDIGMGVHGLAYTQDFGAGAGTPHIPVAMGVHSPEEPSYTVTFWSTWEDDDAPAGLWVETEEDCHEMDLISGSDDRGGWSVEEQAEDGCQPYRFTWETEEGFTGTLPQEGAYQYGTGCDEWIEDAPSGCDLADEEEDDDGGDGDGDGESDGDGEDTPPDVGSGNDGDGSDDDSSGGPDAPDEDPDPSESGGRGEAVCGPGLASCFDDGDDESQKTGCSSAPTQSPTGLTLWLLAGLPIVMRRRR